MDVVISRCNLKQNLWRQQIKSFLYHHWKKCYFVCSFIYSNPLTVTYKMFKICLCNDQLVTVVEALKFIILYSIFFNLLVSKLITGVPLVTSVTFKSKVVTLNHFRYAHAFILNKIYYWSVVHGGHAFSCA